MKPKLSGLYKSTRIGIMIAFVVPVVLLGIACAASTGLPIVWENAYLGAALIFSLVMISNCLNNIVDEKIDITATKAGSKKSRLHTILNVDRGLTRSELLSITVGSGFVFGLALYGLANAAGYLVLGFALFGLFMALEYNLPPLKLAYRPFSELTMLLPSAVVAVIGIQYILVSQVTELGVAAGTAFGLFSGSWFVCQSIIDHDIDKAAGKVTTAVYAGPMGAWAIATLYPVCTAWLMCVYKLVSASYVSWLFVHVSVVCVGVLAVMFMFCGIDAHKLWQRAMLTTFVFGVASALAILYRVWSG